VATESEPKNTAARRMLGAASLSTPKPFAPHGWLEVLETADICARSRQTGDKSAIHWVGDLGEYDRDHAGFVARPTRSSPRPRSHRTDQFCRRGLFAAGVAGAWNPRRCGGEAGDSGDFRSFFRLRSRSCIIDGEVVAWNNAVVIAAPAILDRHHAVPAMWRSLAAARLSADCRIFRSAPGDRQRAVGASPIR
jgi:hypothetical protein